MSSLVGRIPDQFSSLTVEIPPKMDKDVPFTRKKKNIFPVFINTKEEQVSIDYPSKISNRIRMKSYKCPSDFFLKNFYCKLNSYEQSGKYIAGRHIYFYPYKEGVEPTYQTFKALFLRVFNHKERDIKEKDIEPIQQKSTGIFALQVIRVRKVQTSMFVGHVRERKGPAKWVERVKEVAIPPICVRAFGTKAGLYILEDKNFTEAVSDRTIRWFDSFKIKELIMTTSLEKVNATTPYYATEPVEVALEIREVIAVDKGGKRFSAVTIESGSEQVQVQFPFESGKTISLNAVPSSEFVGERQIANLGKQMHLLCQGASAENKYMMFVPYSGKLETYEAFEELLLELFGERGEELRPDIESIQGESTALFALQVVCGRKVKSVETSKRPITMPDGRPGTRTGTVEKATEPVCFRAYGTKAGLYLLNDKTFDGKVMSEGTKEWFSSFKLL